MNSFNKKWITILTDEREDKIVEFEKVRFKSASLTLAIMKYRRLEQEKTEHITPVSSIESLQEAFLEPITDIQIDYLHKKIQSLGIEIAEGYERLYSRHILNKDKRFMYLVNCL